MRVGCSPSRGLRFQRLEERVYTSSQMDTECTDEIEADYADWKQSQSLPDE